MKKSLVAVGVIVALGVAWTGAAWFTGKQLEQRIEDAVSEANRQIKATAPDAGLTLEYANYQRHVFSSRLQIIAKPDTGAQSSWLKPGQSVVLDETVDHGPFPFAQLKKFTLIPSMASVHTQLAQNETTKALFEMAKGQSLINIDTRVGYSGATSSDIALRPLEYSKGKDKMAFSGGNFTANVDSKGNHLTLKGEADSGLVSMPNEYGQQVLVTFNGLKTDGETEVSAFQERTGSQKLSLEKLSLAVEGKEMAQLQGLKINAQSAPDADGKHLNGEINYTLDSLRMQNQDMGQGALTLKVSKLDGAAAHQFSQRYNDSLQALKAQPGITDDPQLYQEKAIDAFFTNLPLLLKGEPVVTVAPLSWKNSKGEGSLTLSLFLKEPAARNPGSAIKSLDGKLTIPLAMATELMTQVAKIEGYQQDEANKLASQQVKGIAAMGQMFRLTTVENDAISTSLQYSGGMATLNGQQLPLEQLLGIFGLTPPDNDAQPEEAPEPPFLSPQP
ncbi:MULTISPECIES: YdgA family protein [Tenebrionibacter/Tenebrionicola group]|jgi:uncharacterized protein YdgA (DUF945 family)|uniref:YdgA family protein n=2 Tax=Tenebrionibacter/Tenebrionicola group TaxID=2969848 RepID=A0A8K0V6V2_9ENTR|nr:MULTISPECIES: YdgA family protein [Tenebrionibacter/Tenebrionicola group]MBK4716473.1 YdgA family protein [Tenebrionibacter intestinalis]MBV5096807.1 YdgA family protein [Tenebrionicola larvae]